MNNTIKNMLSLSEESIRSIDNALESLAASGVKASKEHSGEMNFNGCASGYCMAWD